MFGSHLCLCSSVYLFPCIRFFRKSSIDSVLLILYNGYFGDTIKLNDILSVVPKFQAGGIAGPGYQVSVWMCKAHNCSTLSGTEIS